MELDRYMNGGSFLLSTAVGLKTTDGQTTSALTHNFTTSFTQINSTHVVILEPENHCLKILNRETLYDIQTLAGICGTFGYAEGKLGIGQFSRPWAVRADSRNPGMLVVTDSKNNALRSVNLKTGELSTITRTGFDHPRGMLITDDGVLIANYHYISHVSWSGNRTVKNTLVAGSDFRGNADGSFDKARFMFPIYFVRIRNGKYLVVDGGTQKLRLMDLEKRVIGPVCFNGENPCTTSSSLSSYPFSLLNVEDEIYVGMMHNIYKLSGEYSELLCCILHYTVKLYNTYFTFITFDYIMFQCLN